MREFFDSVRKSFGSLAQNQVDGLSVLLDATKNLSTAHRAYVLATAWHETGPASSVKHMTPRREIWGPTEAQKRYEGRQDLGNTQIGDGKKYMGRGYVQITGRTNYKKASDIVGIDLVSNPDLALKGDVAAKIIVDGMTKGWFTGKKMGDYSNFKDMRRVVNGTDKSDTIASYAKKFEDALKAYVPVVEVQKPRVPVENPPPTPDLPAKKPLSIGAVMVWVVAVIAAIIGAYFKFGG